MTTPAQQPPQQGHGAEYAAGAVGAVPALAPIGSGVGLVALGAGGALSAAAVAEILDQTLDALREHARARVGKQADELRTTLESAYPERTPTELDPIVRHELGRERAFQRKMEARIRRDLPKALGIEEADARREAVDKILAREARYVGMRVQAMHDRAIARAEHLAVQEASPQGAYWWLSPDVQKHTPDCLVLGHQFWPWEFLTEAHPPLHPGCRCELLTLGEAVERGYMTADQVPDPGKAAARARQLLDQAKKIAEAATPVEFATYLLRLAEGELETRIQAIARRFPSVDYGQLWWNAGEGHVFYNLGDADGYQHDIVTRLFSDVPGVRKVEIGDESGTPQGEGWARLSTSDVPLHEARWERRFPKGVHEGGRYAPKVGATAHELLRDLLPDMPTPPRERRDRKFGNWRTIEGRRVFVPEARGFDRVLNGRRYISPPGSSHVQFAGNAEHGAGRTLYVGRKNESLLARVALRRRGAIDIAREQALEAATARDPARKPVNLGAPGQATDEGLLAAGYTEADFKYSGEGGAIVGYWAPDGSSRLAVTYDQGGRTVTGVDWRPRTPKEPAPALTRPPANWHEFQRDLDSFARRTAIAHGRRAVLEHISEDKSYADHAAETFPDGRTLLGTDFRPSFDNLLRARYRGTPPDDVLRQAYASNQSGIHEMLHAATAYDPDVIEDPAAAQLEEVLAEELSHVDTADVLKRRGELDVADWAADHPLDYKVIGSYTAGRAALAKLLDDGHVDPQDREPLLRRLLLDTPPRERIDALARAVGKKRADVRVALAKPPDAPEDFLPILAPSLDPTHRPSALEWHGQPLQAGDRLTVKGLPATLLAADEILGTPIASIRYADGTVEHGVAPARLEDAHPTPPRMAGSAAPEAGGYAEGGRVAWDGGEGTIARILRAGNDPWLDVRLDDGTRAYITKGRAPGLHAVAGLGAQHRDVGVSPTPPTIPRTLEQKAAENRLFDTPPDTPRAALSALVATERPDMHRANRARSGPLRTRPRPDGRLDVVGADSQRLYAAREQGLAHVPVTHAGKGTLFQTWPYEKAAGGRGNEAVGDWKPGRPVHGVWLHGRGTAGDMTPEEGRPLFLTLDPYAAQWFANERGLHDGTVGHFDVTLERPATYKDLQAAVAATNVGTADIVANSPYDGENETDYLYVPKVVAELKKQGFDGYSDWDPFLNGDVPVAVPFSTSAVEFMGSKQVPFERGRANAAVAAPAQSAQEAVKAAGVDLGLAFAPASSGPMHPTRSEYRMRAAAAILAAGAERKDAVLSLPNEDAARKAWISKITTGDVARAQHEFSSTPLGDLEVLAGIHVANHPVQGQANTDMAARKLTMGSSSVTGDFRHELGHALRAAWSGQAAPSGHTALTDYVAKRHQEALARVKANIAAGLPKPKTEPEWEAKLGVIDPRALDSWDEDFAEQYRAYHRQVYRSRTPSAPDYDPQALEKYRTNHPEWARLWDAWYTAQALGRPRSKGRRNEATSEHDLVSRLVRQDVETPLDPLADAFHDKVGGRTYVDKDGNYRYRKANGGPGGPIPPWNDAVKAAFGTDQIAFHHAANEFIRPVTLPNPNAPRGRRNEAVPASEPQVHGNGVAALRDRWARLDRALLPYAGRPNDPAARKIIDEQIAVTSAIHHIHVDEGGPEGIGQPGGPKDVVVVGAGPAGLSAAIYGGTEGLDTLLVDSEPHPGGQAYHSSRIENVLGFPAGLTGRQLAAQGLEQAKRTGAQVEFGKKVTGMDFDASTGMKTLHFSDGSEVKARAVVIAGGVQFRRLQFPGSDSKDVVYGDSGELKKAANGRPIVIVGGANSAGQAAIDCAAMSSHVTLLVRKGSVRDTMSSYLVDQLESAPNVTILKGEVAAAQLDSAGGMRGVTLKDGTNVDAGALGLFIGSAPDTGWASKVARAPDGRISVGHGDLLETSMPGVYAAGDVREGALGRVQSAAGDGAGAISMTHGFLDAMKAKAA